MLLLLVGDLVSDFLLFFSVSEKINANSYQ